MDVIASTRTEGILGKVIALKVCLEQRTHLRVAGPRLVQDQEMELEAGKIDQEGEQDEASSSSEPMFDVNPLSGMSQSS